MTKPCTFEFNGKQYTEAQLKDIYDGVRLSPSTAKTSYEKILESKNQTLTRREKELNQLRFDSSKLSSAAEKKQAQLLIKQKEESIKRLEEQIKGLEDNSSVDYIFSTIFQSDIALLQQYISMIRKNPKSFVEIQEAENIIYFYKAIGDIENTNHPIFNIDALKGLKEDVKDKLLKMGSEVSKYGLELETLLRERVVNHINGNEDIQQKLKKKFTYEELIKAIPDIDAFTRDFLNISKTGIVSGEQSILAELMFYHMAKTNEEATSEIKQKTQVLDKVTEDVIKELNRLGYTGSKTFDLFFEKINGKETGRLISQISKSFIDLRNESTGRYWKEIKGLWKTYYNNSDKTFRKTILSDITKAQNNIDEWYRNNAVTLDIRSLEDLWNMMSDDVRDFYKGFQGTPDNTHKQEIIDLVGVEEYNRLLKEQLQKLEEYIASETVSFENMESNMNIQNLEDTKKYYKYRNNPFYGASVQIDNNPIVVDGQTIEGVQGMNYLIHVPKNIGNYYDQNYKTIVSNPILNSFYTEVSELLQKLYAVLPPDQKNRVDDMTLPLFKQSFSEMLLDKNLSAMTTDMWDGIIDVLTDKENRSTSVDMIDPVTGKRDIRYNYSGLGISERKMLVSKREKLLYSKFVAENNREPNSEEFNDIEAQAQHDVATESSHDIGKILKLFTAYVTMAEHKEKVIPTLTILQKEFEKIKAAETTNIFGIKKTNKFGEIETSGERENANKQVANQMDFFMNRPVNLVELPLSEKKTLNMSEKKTVNEIQAIINSMSIPDKYKNMSSRELVRITVELEIELNQLSDVNEIKENKKLLLLLQTVISLKEQSEDLGSHVTGSGVMDTMLKVVRFNGLAYNLASVPTNYLAGLFGGLIMAADGRYFSIQDYMFGLRQSMLGVLSSLTGGRFNAGDSKKIRNAVKKLDVVADVVDEFTKASLNNISGKLQSFSPYQLTHWTETVLIQSPIIVADMRSTKVKNENGEEVSLYDAFDENGDLKFPVSEHDLNNFKISIVEKLRLSQGDYSKLSSRFRAKRTMIGRAVSVFRTYLPMAIANRWGNERNANLLTGVSEKGRYRSFTKGGGALFGGIIGSMVLPGIGTAVGAGLGSYLGKNKTDMSFGSDVIYNTINLLRAMSPWHKTDFDKKFSELDAANLRANLMELQILLTLFALYLLMKGLMDDDDDKKSSKVLAQNFLLNNILRQSADLQFYSSPMDVAKFSQQLFPVYRLVKGVGDTTNAFGRLLLGDDEIGSGHNKGESRTWNAVQKLVPAMFSLDLVKPSSYQDVYGENVVWNKLLEDE